MKIRSLLMIFLCATSLAYGVATGLVVEPGGNVISWSDTRSHWEYIVSTGDWTWTDIATSNKWSFYSASSVFQNMQTGEQWRYDTTHGVWVNTADSVYDLTTSTTYAHQAWHYDATAKKWSPVTRTSLSGSLYSFAAVSSVYWQYVPDDGIWRYVRAVSGTPTVPVTGEWAFGAAAQTWSQITPDSGSSLIYRSDLTNGQWFSQETGKWWRFKAMTNTQIQWDIVGNTPPDGWDYVLWTLALATGGLTSQAVKVSPSGTGALHAWSYHADDFLWHDTTDGTASPVEGVPLLPPTPFAHYKAVIEDAYATLLASGVQFGSSDGSGVGLIDPTTSSLFRGGTFTFDLVTNMTFVDTVALSGDIELSVTNDAVLTLGTGVPDADVIIQPADSATCAQLIFNVAEEKTLEVRMLNNVYFQANATIPLIVTFRGKGSTVFRLPSGKTLSFAPAAPDSASIGVAVQVLMDLTADDIASGVQQVVFEPWSYAQEDSGDSSSVNTDTNKTTWILFGPSSFLRFVSYNETGTDTDTPGYGSLAFDVCHEGTGRTLLDLAPGIISGLGSDAGINIWGSLVVGTGESGAVIASDLRENVFPNKRAGMLAIVSIIDDMAYHTLVEDVEADLPAWLDRDASMRRGLVVVNNNTTYPYLASNLSHAPSLETSDWAASQKIKGYQPGFILGDNGQLRIRHNLFLDYVAGTTNQAVDPLQLGGSAGAPSTVKLHNASAFIVDQLGAYGASADVSYDMSYAGTSFATIVLEGTAGCFFRCGAASDSGTIVNEITTDSDTGAETLDVTIGVGVYDGTFCPVLDSNGVLSATESIVIDRYGNPILNDGSDARCLDGEHALDIEGELSFVSVLSQFGFPPNGYVTIPSIQIDHAGREIDGVLS